MNTMGQGAFPQSGPPGFGAAQGPMSGPPGKPPTPAKGKRGAKKTKAQPVTENKRRVAGILAIVLAALALILVVNVLNGAKDKGKVYVLVAKSQINPLRNIVADQIDAIEIPEKYVEAGALKGSTRDAVLKAASDDAKTQVVGKTALYPILVGQQIRVAAMLSADGQLRVALAANERLMSITVAVQRGVAGLIRTGDHVDIYTGGENAELVASDVEVALAAPSADMLEATAAKGSDPYTNLPSGAIPSLFVVRVADSVVGKLAAADAGGQLYFTLRPQGTPASSSTTTPNGGSSTTTQPTSPSTTAR